ncbi:MAG TPA: hypothetical protein PLV92_23865, partial [Pirellulaceae bacterium]|nr:hypothetical protein [Pirellulaceae bacterium]
MIHFRTRQFAAAAVLSVVTACNRSSPATGPWFEDRTAASGVDFKNVCGAPGKEYILDSIARDRNIDKQILVR